jgi:hypothetical protein
MTITKTQKAVSKGAFRRLLNERLCRAILLGSLAKDRLLPRRWHTIRLTHQHMAEHLMFAYRQGVRDGTALREAGVPAGTTLCPVNEYLENLIKSVSGGHRAMRRAERRGRLTPEQCRDNAAVLRGDHRRKTADPQAEAGPVDPEAPCKAFGEKSSPEATRSAAAPSTLKPKV